MGEDFCKSIEPVNFLHVSGPVYLINQLVVVQNAFFDSLPNYKILDPSKLKAFSDDKIKVPKTTIFVFDRVENIVGKGENAGYQHFLLFPQCFRRAFYPGSLKVGIVW